MHSMLKRKRRQPKMINGQSLLLPTTDIQFKFNQKYAQFKSHHLSRSHKKYPKALPNIVKNPSLPHLNHSQNHRKFPLRPNKAVLNSLRRKDEDQIGLNKNLSMRKSERNFPRKKIINQLHQSQKENRGQASFRFRQMNSCDINVYDRNVKCNRTLYYFHRNCALQSGAVQDVSHHLGANNYEGSGNKHYQKRLTYNQNKQQNEISNSLQVQGRRPKWNLFEFRSSTDRKASHYHSVEKIGK